MRKKIVPFDPDKDFKVLDYETVFTKTAQPKFNPSMPFKVIDSLSAKEKPPVQPKKPTAAPDENEFLKFWYTNPSVLQWRNAYVKKYGEEPDMNSRFYDYRKAFREGEVPEFTASDPEVPHWSGVSEKNNIELKTDDHPTKWKNDIEKNEEYQGLGKKIITVRKELTDFIGTNKDELGNLPYNLGTGKEVLRKARELKSLVRRYRAIENRTRTLAQITDESIKEIKNKSIILGGEKQLDIANKYSRDVLNYVERTEINDHIEKTYRDMHKKKDPEDWLDMSSFLYRDKNIDETIDEMKLLDPIKVFNELDRIKKLPEYQRANYKGQKTIMQKEGTAWIEAWASEKFPTGVGLPIANIAKVKAAEKEFFSFAPYANFFNEDGTASVEGLKSWAEHQLEITDGLMNDLKAKEIYLYSPERMQTLAGKPAEEFRKNQFEMVKKVEKEKRMLRNTKTLLSQVLLLPDRKDRFLSYVGSGRLFKDIGTGIAAEAYGKKGSATLDIATLGVREAARSLSILSIVNRKNKGEEISKGEEMLLTSFGMLEEITRQSDVPSGYVIGRGLVDMVPYMASFVYSGPTYAAIRAGLKKGLVKKTAGLAKKKAFKITGAGARIFGKTEINMIDMATTNLSRLAAVGGQTLMIPQMYAENIARHMTDDVRIAVSDKYDDIYAMIEENTADRPLPAVFKGTWEGYSEILTEHMGLKLMGAAKLPAKIMKEMGGEKFANKLLLKKYLDIKGFKNLGNVRKRIVNKRLGWHGIREEYAEELANLYMTEIGTGERKKAGKPLWNWKEQFETFMTVALAGGVISGTQYTAKKIAGDNVLYTRKKADGTEQKVRLRMDTHDELLAEFNQEGFINGDKIDEIIQKHNLSKDQIDLVLNLSVEAGKQKVAEGVSGEPKMGPPSYELYGKKVTKKAAEVAIRGAETIEDLNVLKVTNDPELSAQLEAKFEAITTAGKIRAKKPGELTKEQKQKKLDEAVEREKLKAEPDIMFNALKRIGYDVEDATEEEVSSAYTGRVLATIQYQDKKISKEEYAKKMLISEDVPEDQKDDMLEEYQAIFVPRVVTKKTVEGLIAQRAKERKEKEPEVKKKESYAEKRKKKFRELAHTYFKDSPIDLKYELARIDKLTPEEIISKDRADIKKEIETIKGSRRFIAKQKEAFEEISKLEERDAELVSLEEKKPEPEIEAEKKEAIADIERKRQEDIEKLNKAKAGDKLVFDMGGGRYEYVKVKAIKLGEVSFEGQIASTPKEDILREINTKYDAELAALEKARPEPEDYFEGKGIPEKHTELIEDLKAKKKITGKGIFSTRGRFVMTDTEGREFGVMVNHDLDDKQRNVLFTALAEDKTFKTRLVLKEDWNPDDEFINEYTGKPYGDKIEVLLGKLVVGNVQETDFAAGKFVRKTLTPEEEAAEALLKAGNILSQDPTDQQAILPQDKQRLALEAIQQAVSAVIRKGADTVDKVLEEVRKNIKTLNLPDDEKLRLEQYLDVNIPEIERYISGLKLATKTGTKVTVTDMEFTGRHISAENPFATSTERMTAHRSTFRQIFEAVPGVGRIRAEEIVYEITRPEVYDEPGTKKEYEAFLQKTADMGPEHLSLAMTMARKMSFKDAVSFLNFYSSTYLIEVIAVNLKENEGTVTSLNINDALHGLRTNFFYHQNKFTYTTETGKLIDDYEAAIGMSMRTHLKKVYDIVGGFPYGKYMKANPAGRESARRQVYAEDLRFLTEITGIPEATWENYFSPLTKETTALVKKGEKYVEQVFSNYDEFLETDTYYRDRKGTIQPRIHPTIVNTFHANYQENEKTTSTRRNFIEKFFTVGAKGRGRKGTDVFSNLKKLASTIQQPDQLNFTFESVNGTRGVGLLMNSGVYRKAQEIQSFEIDNPVVKYYKEVIQGPIKLRLLNGIINLDNNESAETGEMTIDDVWLSQLVMFQQEEDAYYQNLGQFGDKKKMLFARVPKHEIDKKKYEEIKKWFPRFDNAVSNISYRIRSNFSYFRKGKADIEQARKLAYDFVYNYALNSKALTEIFHGKLSQYETKKLGGMLTDLFKRGASSISEGYNPNEKIFHAALPKEYAEKYEPGEYTHLISNDNIAKILGADKELLDGVQFFLEAEFGIPLQEAMGDVYGKKKEFGPLDSVKAIYYVTNERLLTGLTKTNLVNIDILADIKKDSIFDKLRNFMRKYKIQTLSFESGTKKAEFGKESVKLFDGENFVLPKEGVRHIRDLRNFYIQQDLRQPVTPEAVNQVTQFYANILPLPNGPALTELLNTAKKKSLDQLANEFSGIKGRERQRKWLMEKVDKLGQEHLKQLLNAGASLMEPTYRPMLEKILSSYVTRNGLQVMVNRLTTQAVPAGDIDLRPMKKTKDGKVVLPEGAFNIEDIRYAKWVNSKKKAIKEINSKQDYYWDMFDSDGKIREQEIREDDQGWIIPGEIILSTRVPADDFHSHRLVRAKYRIRAGNFTMLDNESSDISGEDYDGDLRFNTVMFKRDGDPIFGNTRKGLANEVLIEMAYEYYNPENFEMINRPINTKKYDSAVEFLRGFQKEYIEYEAHDPDGFEEGYLKNTVGNVSKAIMVDISMIWSYIKALDIPFKKGESVIIPVIDLEDPEKTKRNIILTGFAKDKYNLIKAHISNITNLAFDNANEGGKIEILGWNEVTASMAAISLMSYQKIDNIPAGLTRDQEITWVDDQLTEFVGRLGIYFSSPEAREFVRLERRRRGVTEKGSITGTRKALLNKFPKLRHRVNSLIDLYFKGRDLQVLGSLRNLSIDAPQTPFELIRAEETYNKVALNKLKLIDTKKIGKGEDIHPLFKLSREVLEFSKKYIFNQNYEFSEAGEDIRSTIEYLILGTEKREFLTNNELKAILRGLNAIGVISAINNGRPFEMIERALYDQMDNLREAHPDNKFLNFVQRVPYTHKEQKRKFIQILDDYKFTPIPDDVLDNIRIDFDKLDEPEKRHFALYVYMKYGTTGSPYNGSYASLMGNEYRTFVSHMNELESDRFNHTKIPAEERENIVHWITQVSPVLNKQFGAKPVEFRGVYDINSTYKYEDAFEKKETKPGDVIRNLQGKLVPKGLTYSSLIGIPVEISDKIVLPIIAKALDKGQEIAKAVDKGLVALRKTGWYKGYSPDKQEQIEKQIIEANKILFEEIEMNVNNYDYAEVKKESESIEYLKDKGIKDLSKITAEEGHKLLKQGGPYIFNWLEKKGFTREEIEDATPEEMLHNYKKKISKRIPDLLVETDISEPDAVITRTAMHIPVLEKEEYFKELADLDKRFKTIDPKIRDSVYDTYLTDMKFIRQIYRELKNFSRFSNFLQDRNAMKDALDEIEGLDLVAKAPLEKYIKETISSEDMYEFARRENEENYQGPKSATKYLAEAGKLESPDYTLQDLPLHTMPQVEIKMLHRGRIGKETPLLQITVKRISEAHEDINEEQFETRIRNKQFEDALGEDMAKLLVIRKKSDYFMDPWEVNIKDLVKAKLHSNDLAILQNVLTKELRRSDVELSGELPEEIDIPEHLERHAKKVIAAIRFLRYIRMFASKYHPKHLSYKKRNMQVSIMFPKIYMSQTEAIKRYGLLDGRLIHMYLAPSVYDNIVVGEQEDTRGRMHPVTYNLKKTHFLRDFNKAKTFSERRGLLKKINRYRKVAVKAYESGEDANHKHIRSLTKVIPVKGIGKALPAELETADKWGALDEMMMSLISHHHMADIAPFAEYVVTKYKGTEWASRYIEIEVDKQIYQINPDRINYDPRLLAFYTAYMRLTAAQVLALNLHAGMNNLTAGTIQDLIMEPGYVINTFARILSPVGEALQGRFATKEEWFTIQKAVNIMKKHRIATVVDDIRYNKLDRAFGKVERSAYVVTEYVERWNQGILFVGMIPKDQWKAYNLDGTLKDDMKDKAFTKMQISIWKNIIQEVHGRYGWDKAQYSYYALGKAIAFLRFPWGHSLFINAWGRRLTDYNNQIHEGFFAGSMRQIKLWNYNKFMSEEKKKQLVEKYKNQDATKPSVFMQMIIDSEGEKINWWDIPKNDRKAIRRAITAISVMLASGAALLFIKGKEEDLLKGKKEGEAKLRKYINARQLSKLTEEERKEYYRTMFLEDVTRMAFEDTSIPFNPLFWVRTISENPLPALYGIKVISKLMMDLINTIIGNEKAKYDKSGDLYQKGELKIINDLMAAVPGWNQIWKNFRLQYRRKTGKIFEEQLDQELENTYINGVKSIMTLDSWRLGIPQEELPEWIYNNWRQYWNFLLPASTKLYERDITRIENALKEMMYKEKIIREADIEHYLKEAMEGKGMDRKERKEWKRQKEDYKPIKEKANTIIQELSKIE